MSGGPALVDGVEHELRTVAHALLVQGAAHRA
jgi:hypothetical protein